MTATEDFPRVQEWLAKQATGKDYPSNLHPIINRYNMATMEDYHRIIKIEKVKKGDYVRKKSGAKKTYIAGGYCRYNKRYELTDTEDMNRQIYLKKGKDVFVGFTY